MERFLTIFFFFFFQAEDGIRDKLVTGVQTCALPISRPVPSCESLHDVRWDGFYSLIHLPSISLHEVTNQQRYILAAVTQGGQDDREDFQAIVQVAAKLSISDHLCKIAVCGRDEARIDMNGLRSAKSFKFLLL